MQGPIWIALALALGAGAWVVWRRARAGQLSAWLPQQTVRLPWMRPYVRSFGLSQLARSGAMLIRSGIPALKALGIMPQSSSRSATARRSIARSPRPRPARRSRSRCTRPGCWTR